MSTHPRGRLSESVRPACDRRVVYILPYLGVGGTEKHVLHLVQAMGWAEPPVVVAPDGALRAAMEAAGARVHLFLNPTGRWVEGIRSFRGAFRAAMEWAQAGGQIPVVHAHSAAELLWLARRWVPRAKFVFTDHGYFGPGAGLSYRLAAALLRRSDAVLIVVSSQQRALWTRRLGIPEVRVRVVHNGVPDPTTEGNGLPSVAVAAPEGPGRQATAGPGPLPGLAGTSPMVVGAVGRLEPQKGFQYLLEAFERVAPEFPDARLLVVGQGSLREVLWKRAQQSPRLRDRVVLPGEVPGAEAWMRHFTVYCLPSLAEALPLSLLEAMAWGCPIVATAVGGVPEALGYGQAGLLVPPRDVQALAAALRRLLADAALRERLGRLARQCYTEHFTDAAMARGVAALYAAL